MIKTNAKRILSILSKIFTIYTRRRHFPKPTYKKHTPVSGDDGCIDGGGLVIGTYLHGLFGNENIRHALMSHLHERKGVEYAPEVADSELDVYGEFAGVVRKNVGVARVF